MEIPMQLELITLYTLASSAVAHLCHFKCSMDCITVGLFYMLIQLDHVEVGTTDAIQKTL